MRIGRWFAVIAIAAACVLVVVQGGIADAATSTTSHLARLGHQDGSHHARAFTPTSGVSQRLVDSRFRAGVPAAA